MRRSWHEWYQRSVISFYLSVHINTRDENATSVADIRPEDRDDYAAGIISNPKEKI